jgi:Tat protein translocase TatB subunit
MFDITSSKLLILGIVALLVIGPKDLPALLRTIGKYMGIIKRHAADFRAQFDEAMRESELEQLKKTSRRWAPRPRPPCARPSLRRQGAAVRARTSMR